MHSRGTARALLKGKAAEEATVRAARDARTSPLFVSSRGTCGADRGLLPVS